MAGSTAFVGACAIAVTTLITNLDGNESDLEDYQACLEDPTGWSQTHATGALHTVEYHATGVASYDGWDHRWNNDYDGKNCELAPGNPNG